MAAVPKNPLTDSYIQSYHFMKPDCQLYDMDYIVLDPIYKLVNNCLTTKVPEQIGYAYSLNMCSNDAATILSNCTEGCGRCTTKTVTPLNKCVNNKDGTSKITFCGAIKYAELPKMVWQLSHVVTGKYEETCMNDNIAKISGYRTFNCAKAESGRYFTRKCGAMFGDQMWESAYYIDPECTNRAGLVRGELNICDPHNELLFLCM